MEPPEPSAGARGGEPDLIGRVTERCVQGDSATGAAGPGSPSPSGSSTSTAPVSASRARPKAGRPSRSTSRPTSRARRCRPPGRGEGTQTEPLETEPNSRGATVLAGGGVRLVCVRGPTPSRVAACPSVHDRFRNVRAPVALPRLVSPRRPPRGARLRAVADPREPRVAERDARGLGLRHADALGDQHRCRVAHGHGHAGAGVGARRRARPRAGRRDDRRRRAPLVRARRRRQHACGVRADARLLDQDGRARPAGGLGHGGRPPARDPAGGRHQHGLVPPVADERRRPRARERDGPHRRGGELPRHRPHLRARRAGRVPGDGRDAPQGRLRAAHDGARHAGLPGRAGRSSLRCRRPSDARRTPRSRGRRWRHAHDGVAGRVGRRPPPRRWHRASSRHVDHRARRAEPPPRSLRGRRRRGGSV